MNETSGSGARPKHLAIIMDGNGRWAQNKKHNRLFGHLRGAKVAKNIIEECSRVGLEHLTLYTFSTENWGRPDTEVSFLMKLLARYLKKERDNCVKDNIHFSCIGQIDRIPQFAQDEINKTIEATKNNTGLKLVFALSYGGRQEIINATKHLATRVAQGEISCDDINEDMFSQHLESHPLPDPDLIIRTSGESRLSNFFTWQSTYSELYITQTLWPDFTKQDLHKALLFYNQSERRFGCIQEPSDHPTYSNKPSTPC